ncbi:MAG: hypothetical protein ACI4MT_06085 [Christensenellales bacterium]
MKNDRVIFELSNKYSKGDLNAGIDLLKCFAYDAFICDYRNGFTYEALSYKSLGLKKGATLYGDLTKSFKILDKDKQKNYESEVKGIDKHIKQSEKTNDANLKKLHKEGRIPMDKTVVEKQSEIENQILAKYGFDYSSMSSTQLNTTEEVY